MAIIGKIREKSWLILIVIGGALVTFIFTSQGPGGSNQVEEKYGIGTIYGEKVDDEGFRDRIDKEQKGAQRQKDNQLQQQGRQPGSEAAEPVDQTVVWQRHVEELVLDKEYKALGIEVSQTEFDAYLFGEEGFSVLPDIAQGFSDSAKVFNPKLLQARIDEMESSSDPKTQEMWEESKEYYTEQRKKQKYLDILGQGVYVTNLEAKDEYFANEEKKSISFVVKRYAEIDDKEIKVTDKKLRAFYKKHKDEEIYKNKFSSREIRFADILIQPTSDDSLALKKTMAELKTKFEKTKKDSMFVMANSEARFYIPQIGYKAVKDQSQDKQQFTYPNELDTLFKTAIIGDVIGPYVDNGTMKIAKVIGKKDQFLTARHILIGAQRTDTAAVKRAQKKTDSLMAFITKDNFEQYVTEFSEDPGSKEKGGKYEDFLDGEMVPEFSKFAVEKPIGEIGYVQTDFGFHIMEVLERKPANIPNLAIVQKTIKPSAETLQNLESQAYQLLEKLYKKAGGKKSLNKKIAMFDTLVKREGAIARPIEIQDNRPQLNEFSTAFAETEIYKLAFSQDAKAGDILTSPIRDGQRWIVAMVSAIRVKGESNFEDVKSIVEREYIEEFKSKKLQRAMKGKSLEELGKTGQGVQTADVMFGSTQLGKFIRDEPNIIGALFGSLKDGKMTTPLKGKEGVYVVRLEKTFKPTPAEDYSTQKDQITGTIRKDLKALATKALIEQADVIDNRRFREIGLRN